MTSKILSVTSQLPLLGEKDNLSVHEFAESKDDRYLEFGLLSQFYLIR